MGNTQSSEVHKQLPVFLFPTLTAWISWLDENHAKYTPGIWVKIAKKGSSVSTTTYEEIREGCLIYGWIDSLPNTYSNDVYLLKVTPRRPKSIWSKINRALVETLIHQHRMKPSGMNQVEAAKTDGRWEAAYDSPKDMIVPDDFVQAVKKIPSAFEFYESLNRTNRYTIAFALNTAKREETRIKRFATLLEKMKNKEKLS